jgi:type IV pilus assembly protein PilX
MVSLKKLLQKALHNNKVAVACGESTYTIQGIKVAYCLNKETTTLMYCLAPTYNKQSGVVLVVSLIMLLLLTLVGLSGMQSTILEEKMAGNMRDRNLAFQAAEAALQDAEQHIIGGSISGFTGFTPDCGASTPNTTDNGLCDKAGGYNPPVWQEANVWNVTRSVEYGAITTARKIGDTNGDGVIDVTPALSAQPRYIIEAVIPSGTHLCDGTKPCYRVTARGQGVNLNTVVVLQTIYKPS